MGANPFPRDHQDIPKHCAVASFLVCELQKKIIELRHDRFERTRRAQNIGFVKRCIATRDKPRQTSGKPTHRRGITQKTETTMESKSSHEKTVKET